MPENLDFLVAVEKVQKVKKEEYCENGFPFLYEKFYHQYVWDEETIV